MKKIFFTILVFIIGIALGIGIMYVFNNDSKNNVKKEEITEENSSKYVSLRLEDDNCINCNDSINYLEDSNVGVSITLEDSRTVHLFISNLEEWVLSDSEQSFTINNFSKDIIDIHIGSIFPALDGTVIIFLMEDGSLEYIPLDTALRSNNVKSYGKIDGVEDIVKIYDWVAKTKGLYGGGPTIFAQKIDGTFYDLGQLLYDKL